MKCIFNLLISGIMTTCILPRLNAQGYAIEWEDPIEVASTGLIPPPSGPRALALKRQYEMMYRRPAAQDGPIPIAQRKASPNDPEWTFAFGQAVASNAQPPPI